MKRGGHERAECTCMVLIKGGNKMNLSKKEAIIIAILSMLVIVLLVVGFSIFVITYGPQLVSGDAGSTDLDKPADFFVPTFALPPTRPPVENILFTPTVTESSGSIATRFVVATPTREIYPSITPVIVIRTNTPVRNPPPQNPPSQNNPPPQNPGSQNSNNCTAQLNYAKSTHQYNLARIQQIYQPLIDFYQSMIDDAVRQRDALKINDYQRKLAAEKQQLNAAISAENKRYQGEVAYIKATCK